MEQQTQNAIIDLNQVLKQFKEIKEENDKLKFYKNNYIEIANKLEKSKNLIYEELNKIGKLIEEIDPAIVLQTRKNGSRNIIPTEERKRIYNEILEKMRNGVHISRKMIEETYNIANHQANYIWQKIEKIEKVQKRIDKGKISYLYF